MTFQELSDECWRDMPPLRRLIAGRNTVSRLLADAVMEFDADAAGTAGYADELLGRVKARNAMNDRDGFAILTFLLVTIAAAVISWLIQRWLDNHFPRTQLDEWKKELVQ